VNRGRWLAAIAWLLALGIVFPWSGLPPTRASLPPADHAVTWHSYLPLVASSEPLCPPSSPHSYTSGVAYQFDQDDPVRPAAEHADKNLALRGYAPTHPAVRDFVDYGCDDDTQPPPQFATLFDPPRVPVLTSFHRVHHWVWEQSPHPGQRGDPITDYPVTALGLETTPGETLVVPISGYTIGGHPPMQVLVLFADEDTVALRYTEEDSSGSAGYTVHVDNICTDPNLLALYNTLDDPGGPRYIYPNPEYPLPSLPAGQPFGVARGTEIVVAISDSGAFQDPRSWDEWWQERPGYPSFTRYPSDSHYTKQWGLETIDAPAAWALATGQHTTIAIVDTGVDLNHPDLSRKVLAGAGWDFVNHNASAHDDHGHGTHVAGIAAAATDNGIGIAGLGWHANILPLKVLDHRAGISLSGTSPQPFHHAVEAGVDVINLSLAPETSMGCPPFLQQAIDAAHAAGVVTVAAAGNSGGTIDVPPANCHHVLGVTATRSDDTAASFSSYGNHVSVAAPGSHIFSTWWDQADPAYDYRYLSGTSMATPHVAGLAALLLSRYPGYSPDQVASAILDNAVDLGAPGWDEHYGCGRIDAARALRQGAQAGAPVCAPAVTSSSQGRQHAPTDEPFAPGEIIVQFRPGAAAAPRWRQQTATAQFLPSLQVWRLRVPVGQEQAVLSRLLADPDVLHANLNYLVFAQ